MGEGETARSMKRYTGAGYVAGRLRIMGKAEVKPIRYAGAGWYR